MGYFQARSDLRFLEKFRRYLLFLWKIEGQARQVEGQPPLPGFFEDHYRSPGDRKAEIQERATGLFPYYQGIRALVAKDVPRVTRLAERMGISTAFRSSPMAAVGGRVIVVNLFEAILTDSSYDGTSNQMILDALNQTIGAYEERVVRERRRLWNPLIWIIEAIAFVIRIPFLILETAGFDRGKIEDHFLAKIFMLAEFLAIVILLGLKRAEILDLLKKLLLE